MRAIPFYPGKYTVTDATAIDSDSAPIYKYIIPNEMKRIEPYAAHTILEANFTEEMNQTLILFEEAFLQSVPMRKSGGLFAFSNSHYILLHLLA